MFTNTRAEAVKFSVHLKCENPYMIGFTISFLRRKTMRDRIVVISDSKGNHIFSFNKDGNVLIQPDLELLNVIEAELCGALDYVRSIKKQCIPATELRE